MNKKFVPVPVAENLTWEDFSRVNLHLPYLPGVQCDVGETRDYPFGPELVHILGYVASVVRTGTGADDDPLMSLPGMRIGKRGIEKQFDKQIRGQRRRVAGRSQRLWPHHPRAGQGCGRAGRGCLSHHRPPGAAAGRPEAGQRKRRHGGDGCATMAMSSPCPRRRASIPTGSMSGFRRRAMARPDHRRPQAAAEQGDQRHLSARLDLQDRRWRWRRWRRASPRRTIASPATARITLGNHTFHCWRASARPWHAGSRRRHQEQLRRLLL